MAEPKDLRPQLKGKYSLGDCIRCGGMGVVHAGWTVGAAGFAQQVAIKRIHSEHSSDPELRALFVTEARLSSYLRHRNIVRALDFDEDETGALFLVMEYVDGVELDVLMRTGCLPLPMALFITGELLQALSYAHDLPAHDLPAHDLPTHDFPESDGVLGLVHRDVSPHNVLLSWEGTVQLSDFGIAKARTTALASASPARGKHGYMSPEQFGGLPLDGRSDVFSVGVVLREMVNGPAREGRHGAPSPGAPLPHDAEIVLSRMLQERPEDRYTAAAALAAIVACADYPRSGCDALAALLHARFPQLAPVRGQPPPTPETHERPPPLHLLTLDLFLEQVQQSRRRRLLARLAAMGVAGALSSTAYLALREPSAAELRAFDLELPSPAEPPASPSARFAAPEHAPPASPEMRFAVPERAPPQQPPASSQQGERKPPERTPAGPPKAPENDFRIIELLPEQPKPSRTGENS